jgi:ribonuclease-3
MFLRNLFKKKTEFETYIESLLQDSTNDINLYITAFTHSSCDTPESNERLEFLGDSVIGSIIASYLFQNSDHQREGYLTKTKSKIVSRANLNDVAKSIDIEKHIISKTPIAQLPDNALGNAFEALIGAIYIDKGYHFCEKFILRTIPINLKEIDEYVISYKSSLIEWCQKTRKNYHFELVDIGTKRNPSYRANLFINGTLMTHGTSTSKKKAEEIAAENAIFFLEDH